MALVKAVFSDSKKPVRLMRTRLLSPHVAVPQPLGQGRRGTNRQRRIDSIRNHRWTDDCLGASASGLRCVGVGVYAADHIFYMGFSSMVWS